MSVQFYRVNTSPEKWNENNPDKECNNIVSMEPWKHGLLSYNCVKVIGRKTWGAPEPIWRNEIIYYNTNNKSLSSLLNAIVIHHTNNSNSVRDNELKQQRKGYAALGYHFFVTQQGDIYEGRPLEVMGSHAGAGIKSGPLNDPDWGKIGIVLQGDYHREDDWFFHTEASKPQLNKVRDLIKALSCKFCIYKLLLHREIQRSGTPTVCPGDFMAEKITKMRQELKMEGP